MDWQGETAWMWDSDYGWAPCDARTDASRIGGYEQMNNLQGWKYHEAVHYHYQPWQAKTRSMDPPVVQLRPASSLFFSEGAGDDFEQDVRPQLPSGLLDDEEDFHVKTRITREDRANAQRFRHPMAPNQVQHPTLQAQFGMGQVACPTRPPGAKMGGAIPSPQHKGQAPTMVQVSALAELWQPKTPGSLAPPTEVSPGITVGQVDVWGMVCTRVEWRIDEVREKLQASMGRPLVSPPFAARGLPNLRLMVFPDAREAAKGVRQRERKGLYATMVKKGPVHASLKLKADCLQDATVLRFHLTVGTVRCGPFTYDYAECAVHGCEDFNIDWLKEIDEVTECLRVGVEILDVVDPADCPAELFVLPSNGSHRMCRDEPSLRSPEGRPLGQPAY